MIAFCWGVFFMVLPPFVLSPGLAGLSCADDADGLRHDTDVVGNGFAHIGLVLLWDLAESIVDAVQYLLLLFLAHGITSNIDFRRTLFYNQNTASQTEPCRKEGLAWLNILPVCITAIS